MLADLSLIAGVAGSILLLLRRKLAAMAFLVLLLGVAIQNLFELADGMSLAYGNRGAAVATGAIVVIALLNWLYARAMMTRPAVLS